MLRWFVFALASLLALATCKQSQEPKTNGAGDAGAAEELTGDPLDPFLQAARTDITAPFLEGAPGAAAFYERAAMRLGENLKKDRVEQGGRRPHGQPAENGSAAREIVLLTLGNSNDARATDALVQWAKATLKKPDRLRELLRTMRWKPRAAFLQTVRDVLEEPTLAGTLDEEFLGLFSGALETSGKVSLHTVALVLAVVLPGPEGKALVREMAMKRSSSRESPNPVTLAALTCPDGFTLIDSEASALSSLRLMALSILGDKVLAKGIAADPRESAFVRGWAQRMAQDYDPIDRTIMRGPYRTYWQLALGHTDGSLSGVTPPPLPSPCLSMRN